MSDTNSKSGSFQVKCPQCGLLTFYSPENPSRPFCSDRCKLIDLGEWASETYKVPVQNSSNHFEGDPDKDFPESSEDEDGKH